VTPVATPAAEKQLAMTWEGPDGLKAQLLDKLEMEDMVVAQLFADAKLAKAAKTETRFQSALLVCTVEVHDLLAGMKMASSMCLPGEVRHAQEFPRDFPERVHNLEIRFWDEKKPEMFGSMTLKEFVTTTAFMRRSLFLVSDSGNGKTEITKALGRMHCRRTGKSQYVCGKALDPIGILSKHNEVTNKAMLGLMDFEMRTLMDTELTTREKINLFSLDEQCDVRGRYHMVQIPAKMPKVFSANFGASEIDGSPDAGGYFEEFKMLGLAALARGNLPALRNCSDPDKALARRVAMLVTNENFGIETGLLEADLDAELEEQLARESAYWTERGEA